MSKWYEVDVTLRKTYVVEVNDDDNADDAKEVVADQCIGDDFDIDNCIHLESEPVIKNAKVLADEVL